MNPAAQHDNNIWENPMNAIYRYFLNSPKIFTLGALTTASFLFNLWTDKILTANYIASKFPVPFFTAQLSFDPEKIKAWYAFLINEGTLDQYIHTQNIDSLFILSTLFLHGFGLLLISRLFSAEAKGRHIMVICALISAIAPLSDQLENLVSYVMLANPSGFSDALAYLYSTFAATKFVFFVFAYLAAPIGLVIGLIQLFLHLKRGTPWKFFRK